MNPAGASVSTCGFLCSRDEQCASASFYPNTKKCYLHSPDATRAAPENLKPAMGIVFLRKVCSTLTGKLGVVTD